MSMCEIKFLGCTLLTDYAPLAGLMTEIHQDTLNPGPAIRSWKERLEALIPGFVEGAVEVIKELEFKRLKRDRLVYTCFRLQAWAAPDFDADPSSARRLIPAGVDVL